MDENVKLSRLESTLESHSWPASQSDLVAAYTDTRVLYADGEDDLGELIAGVDQERFESAADLYVALQNVIPVAAVGEPGQSDGNA